MAPVLFEKRGHIAIVTLNRPEARNAFSPEMLVRLGDAWKQVRDDGDIRAAVVTGAGDKAFCAGADLGKLIPLISGARKPEDEWDQKALEAPDLIGAGLLRTFDAVKPVIAAINGHAIAGGMELAQGTDMRVAVESAKFGVQEVKWAIFPGGGSTVRLPRQVPYARAMELLLTGDLISAQEAYELGFLNRVVPDGKALEAAMELAEKISANGPIAVQAIRKSARECLGRPEEEAMKIESRNAAPVFKTEDAREGPKAFMEKRKPVYKGR
ncbi:crotonase/enoyl-CoA hydratase family protein [Parvibaculum sp.]|jgi:enoyl-CoA hydratase|uniref:crotonase/enoyl-CoA hydratase family protein n=1 Tax=Parvibaculum sp. TaxID=2024848 RepID=UPI000EC304BC|nr:crotonase/enoyl-CoA hydratase family protein [Parvibaculum sp.]MBO6678226.1 crotonase/enoyl-CoA hydratase family protein [Parvibaculum sp.]MBO6685458.1 crotonase/enoyl-CoA hydratase family protein [Parvibaculum sp.]HAC58456.1 crotonase/enoyl-CoA hydratase family protein [Rhodobiaceae bacterium]